MADGLAGILPDDRGATTSRALDERASPTWGVEPDPDIAVLICTYRRPGFLVELVDSLARQDLPLDRFEVVIVDDASGDGSWEALRRIAEDTPLRLLAVRQDRNRGPAASRNLAVHRSCARLLAFTDDDCLPTPSWLTSLRRAFEGGVDVVQGRTLPHPEDFASAGPWDHTIWVEQPSPFFETCNVGYRRSSWEQAGGFDDRDRLLRPSEGRHFGEDAELAWRVVSTGGGTAFAADALVHHRCLRVSFRRWLQAQRQADRFPGLARRSPLVARWLLGGIFLSSRTAAFDAAVVGGALTAASRRPWPLLAAVPWVRGRWADSLLRSRGYRRRALLVLAGHAVSDGVMLLSLIEGTIRYRRVVL